LEELQEQRQVYVEKFGRDAATGGPFTEADLDAALGALSLQVREIKCGLDEIRLLANFGAEETERHVLEYVAKCRNVLEWIIGEPETDEEATAQFEARRELVRVFVRRVVLRRDQPPEIIFTLDLAPLLKNGSRGY